MRMNERDVYCGSLEVAESYVTLRLTTLVLRCYIVTIAQMQDPWGWWGPFLP